MAAQRIRSALMGARRLWPFEAAVNACCTHGHAGSATNPKIPLRRKQSAYSHRRHPRVDACTPNDGSGSSGEVASCCPAPSLSTLVCKTAV